jgi:hypothetical protein
MASEISTSQINAIVAEYNDGATLRQLGERHGLYAVRIQRILKANGVVRRKPGRRQITSLTERKCWRCKVVKPIDEFMRSKRQPSGYDYKCKICSQQLNRRHSLKRTYGITTQEYAEMLAEQEGLCAICRRPESAKRRGRVKPLAVDHCHDSSRVRGLLCHRCNAAIGLLQDDVNVLQQAIVYLTEPKRRALVIDVLPNQAIQRTRGKAKRGRSSKVASR